MKHTIRFIILIFALVIAGAGNVRAITADDVIFNILPNSAAGTVKDVSVSGNTVTFTAEPATGYSIDANHIIAEKMVDAMAPRRTSGLASKLDVTDNGSNSFSFTIPEGYTGAYVTVNFYKTTANGITSLADIPNTPVGLAGNYVLTADVNAAGFESLGNFTGTLDGGLHKIIGLSAPLFSSTSGSAIIRNIIFEDVNISSGDSDGDAGAVTAKATGNTRIYNCGINPSSVERDNEGNITGFYGSSVSGSRYVGGLVGLLDGTARVINCYSYANITGGSVKAGIVGYNSYASKYGKTDNVSNIRTMVMNCMFYGNITTGNTVVPIYGGEDISNNNDNRLNNYNYFLYEAPFSKNNTSTNVIISKYNHALAAEERFLNRFEFYRLLLNSNRELAAWYVDGSVANARTRMAKWVLDKRIAPYPILKVQGKYPSVINYDPNTAPVTPEEIKELTVNISGTGITTSQVKIPITDKDPDNFNYNYHKVQLPYFNDVGTGNYTGNQVVTGWEVTVTGGTTNFTTTNYDAPNYNFADRQCTGKDNYATSGRIFSQGAYFDVPEGVSSISITPHWAKCVYLSDTRYDSYGYESNKGVDDFPKRYSDSKFNGQDVYTSFSTALTALNTAGRTSTSSVYDYAVVLVGNVHQKSTPKIDGNDKNAFTVMSADLDGDNEPDYSLIINSGKQEKLPQIRFDFLNVPGTAMAHKQPDSNAMGILGNMNFAGWFEVTNTCVIRFSQFEYDGGNKSKLAPLILQGGVVDQFVCNNTTTTKRTNTEYIHVGGNVWFQMLSNGNHMDKTCAVLHQPISVTGGDYETFYLSGYFSTKTTNDEDNAECYIDGGRFGEVAGAGQEQIKGDVTWKIDHADIEKFFGGGINDNKPITGSIDVSIKNSNVNLYCGGPKFGNMQSGKSVVTNANNCTFGTYFGAGYGGTALERTVYAPSSDQGHNRFTQPSYPWNEWLNDEHGYQPGQANTEDPNSKGRAVSFEYDFFEGTQDNRTVGRLYVNYATMSTAQTNDVTSTLTNCHVTRNFYGGGSLGKVTGTATSTLTGCTVDGNVFGAGYSASVPTVDIYRTNQFDPEPNYNKSTGVFEKGGFPETDTYTWTNDETLFSSGVYLSTTGGNWIYTDVDLSNLGQVQTANLTITGNTTVGKSVYGGGEESAVNENTTVSVTSGIIGVQGQGGAEYGNVYGGGKGKNDDVKAGLVKGNTNVTISGSPTIYHNVYGGGAYGSVGDFVYDSSDKITDINKDTDNKVVSGKCTVTITGGTFGWDGKENGMVFGSSRGDVGEPNGITDKQAWVYDTEVVIGTANSESNATPHIKGSVYGGGENGHNYHDAKVTMYSGTIGITDTQTDGGARYPNRGNVYGGGCGTDTYEIDHDDDDSTPAKIYFNRLAGIVRGNTEVNITGGHVVHNVYGGGAMGSVGLFTREASDDIHMPGKITSVTSNTGKCTVTVSGGTVGNTGAKMINETGGPDDFGHVFGAGRGEVQALADYPNLERVIYVDNTDVTISGGLVTGSVYGGSESGHVLGNTVVKIQGGQIGCGVGQTVAYTDTDWSATSLNPTAHWTYSGDHSPYDQYASTAGKYDYTNFTNIPEADRRSTSEGGRPTATDGHTFFGNVFGGGSGYYPYAPGYWLRSAGQVGGTATVTISGGHILNNVYGGCEMADIEGAVTVTMTGGTVGVPRTKAEIEALPTLGHIYGAGMGDKRIFFNTSTNVAQTTVSVSGGTVYGSVYGGGEDGHVLGNTTTTISQAANKTTVIGCDGKSGYDGNVFGGGQGSVTAKTAGVVAGDVVVNIEGGTMKGSVYGGGRLASVGTYFAMANHANYGKMQADVEDDTSTTEVNEAESHGHIKVNLTGGTIHQNVYGGCMGTTDAGDDSEDYGVSKTVEVNLNKPQCEGKDADNIGTASGCAVKGDIFGCNNTNASPQQTVTVHVYGTQNAAKNNIATKFFKATADLNDIVTLSSLKASVAGLNSSTETPTEKEAQYNAQKAIYDDENSTAAQKQAALAEMKAIILLAVADELGINTDAYTNASNENKLTALENIKKAINESKYDVHAVYGGGNLAAYKPIGPSPTTTSDDGKNTTYSTNVIIDGCGLTSIQYAYGGGNAASTPATNVTVNGTYEIEEVFGGGNGKDAIGKDAQGNDIPNPGANVGFYDYSSVETTYNTKEKRQEDAFKDKYTYGSGKASVNIYGGTIHRVFGGSNTKGNVRITAVTMLEEAGGCDFCVDEAYGGGKSAPMDAEAKLHMACIPGLSAAYGGAEAADIQGNVTLNITNGTFDRVFGGNNLSGTIKGSITVNIEEVGCKPIKIGELYGGGNQAGYSIYGYDSKDKPIEKGDDPLYDDPQVNVKSFTSIGNIYGGGFGTGATMVGNPTVNINEAYGRYYNDDSSEVGDNAETPNHYPIPSHAKGKIGAINNVFGGGNAAKVIGNTAVNIAIIEEVYVVKEVAAGASVIGYYTRSGKGTTADPFVYTALTTGTAVDGTTYYEKKDVMGVDIRGNVYGGGNNAEVTGNTNVVIGKQETTTTTP